MASLATLGFNLMKKISILLIAAMFAVGLFAFSACGKDETKNSNGNSIVQDENGIEFPEEWN